MLRSHLTRGYTLDHQRLRHNAKELEAALQMARRTAKGPELANDESGGLLDIVTRFDQTSRLLQR